jgi:hypothetical protein
VQQLAGTNINYPAYVYEWEMRAWRLLGTPTARQYRALFPKPERAHRLDELHAHLEERIRQLETVLARL